MDILKKGKNIGEAEKLPLCLTPVSLRDAGLASICRTLSEVLSLSSTLRDGLHTEKHPGTADEK